MSNVCPTCFLERSATGACDCSEATLASAAVLERASAPAPAPAVAVESPLDFLHRLLEEHGLSHIKVGWHRGVGHIGRTHFLFSVPTDITFSKTLWPTMTDAQRRDVVAHEVAHALVGVKHQHDAVWQRKCLELGGSGLRSDPIDMGPAAKWTGVCPNGHTNHRMQKSTKMFTVSCGECRPYYDPSFLFTWKQNH